MLPFKEEIIEQGLVDHSFDFHQICLADCTTIYLLYNNNYIAFVTASTESYILLMDLCYKFVSIYKTNLITYSVVLETM